MITPTEIRARRQHRLIALLVVVGSLAGCAVDEGAQLCAISNGNEFDAQRAAAEPTVEPPPDPPGATSRQDIDPQRQYLVVTNPIPAGTTVRGLIEDPTVYLSARALPPDLGCPTSVTSMATLQQSDGKVVAVQIEAGQFLDTRQFNSQS